MLSVRAAPARFTIGVQEGGGTDNSLVERDYFLGTPPSLNLTDSSTVRSYALFFEGMSSSLNFRFNPDLPSGVQDSVRTRNDALEASCISDFMSQVRDKMKTILTATGQN